MALFKVPVQGFNSCFAKIIVIIIIIIIIHDLAISWSVKVVKS